MSTGTDSFTFDFNKSTFFNGKKMIAKSTYITALHIKEIIGLEGTCKNDNGLVTFTLTHSYNGITSAVLNKLREKGFDV